VGSDFDHTAWQHALGDATEAADVAARAAVAGEVLAVEVDVPVTTMADPMQPSQWGLAEVGAPAAWPVSRGEGVTVAVLDTGVQSSHPDLAGQVLPGRSFLSQGQQSPSTADGNGHGTHVAGIVAATTNSIGIAGIAPGAKVLPVKVLADDGTGWLSDVAAGLTWAVDNGAKVANLSLGGGAPSGALHVALVDAMARGTLVVVAAGNSGPCAAVSYPAAYPEVLAVGSIDQARKASSFSTTGNYVDIAAPGSMILSTWPTNLVPSGYQYASGTSMAAPHVAAAAASVWSHKPSSTVTQVRAALQGGAVDLMVPGRDQWTGSGLVNVPAALQR